MTVIEYMCIPRQILPIKFSPIPKDSKNKKKVSSEAGQEPMHGSLPLLVLEGFKKGLRWSSKG